MLSLYTCTGVAGHHLPSRCSQPPPFMHVVRCGCVCVCASESVQQLYLHLYGQIPVGRTAEEHTSCLTYIPYQAVFVCTGPCDTHTHARSQTDSHVGEACTPFVGSWVLLGGVAVRDPGMATDH